MQQLVESIKERGVITPATVRQKEDGRYELISGHRRKRASELAGFDTLRCEVVDLNRDEATILMVESNFQRSQILPSEKAYAYKMRLDAMKRQGFRSDLTSDPLGQKFSVEQIADNKKAIVLELSVDKDKYIFSSSISEALVEASDELNNLDDQLNETLETIKNLTPNCDKYDYILSASSGALCGIIDVFLVGKPGESPLGDITDEWFANRTIDFAKLCGYQGEKDSLSSAVSYLEQKFKIPYDQSVGGGVFRELINLTPSNHHFKSLGHNPTLLGLFFSI